MKSINKLLDFVKLMDSFRLIKRDIPVTNNTEPENDAEHSYQLAMVCWYIATSEGLDLDIDKILKYSLVHDLAEVYAGDTSLYTVNDTQIETKNDREIEAIAKIKERFPDFTDLNVWLNDYQKLSDEESRFVFAIDKLLPIIIIYLDKGYGWRTHKVDIDLLIEKNKERVSKSPVAEKYFDLLLEEIQNKPDMLNKNKNTFRRAISHNRDRCDVRHVDIDSFDQIPDDLKYKAHAVCLHNGKMVLVNHPEWDIWSIPGGTRDDGEPIEKTLHREVWEETNCRVEDYKPIAYQEVIRPSGEVYHYRLQYMCNVVPLGEFGRDTAGNIDKITWIDPTEFEEYIEEKEFKRLVIRRAIELLKQ